MTICPMSDAQTRTAGGVIKFPAHPHEGAVGVPKMKSTRVIATGKAK
jgi:hypothetical protein